MPDDFARAIRWLKEHFVEPLRIETLARQVRMSPSAFDMHIKAVTALNPVQYQKRLRLQEARSLMLGDGLDAASAGFRVGYESPSHFSREYRRLFGAAPRRDRAPIRTTADKVGDNGLYADDPRDHHVQAVHWHRSDFGQEVKVARNMRGRKLRSAFGKSLNFDLGDS